MIYTPVRLLSKMFFGLWGKLEIVGETNLSPTGPVILVANHISLLDGFLLVALWPRRITFLSAAYLFEKPAVGSFLRSIGAISVQNEGVPLKGMRRALDVLQSGATLGIFPEGRICQSDNLGPFQTGWAYLALKTGTPALPVVININRMVKPTRTFLPRRRRILVQIAEPWTMEKIPHPQKETLASMNMRLIQHMENILSKG